MSAARSIGRRLTLLLAAIAALLALLSWAMVAALARQAAERTQDNVLAAAVSAIAETIRTESGAVRLTLPYTAFSMLGAISEDRVFYLVATDEAVLTGYPDLPVPTSEEAHRPGHVSFATGAFRGEGVRIASLTRRVPGAAGPVPVAVHIAQTQRGVGLIAGELSRRAALLALAFFLLAAALAFFAARASLAPLTEIARAVARRGPTDLRPLRRREPAELTPLVDALNRLMGRLGQSIHRSEEFIAEAAHRVRTPLATVRAQAEIALRGVADAEERQRLRRIIRAVDESSRSAGQILDHAAVAFRSEALERTELDLVALVRRAAATLEPVAAMRDIALRVDARPARVAGDAVLLDSALRNVLDNAIKYSPEDTTVLLRVEADAALARVSVRDEGPGLGAEPPERLIARFQRGDTARGIVGSGLGLTIASDVLSAHGGRLDLARGPEGRGACVTLVLPSA